VDTKKGSRITKFQSGKEDPRDTGKSGIGYAETGSTKGFGERRSRLTRNKKGKKQRGREKRKRERERERERKGERPFRAT